MKILYCEAATDYWGQERYIHRLMLKMRDEGNEVHALCQPHAELTKILKKDGFVVHDFCMETKFKSFWRNLFPIKKLIESECYDVVNTNSRKDTIHVGVAAKLAKTKPLIVRTRHLAKKMGSLLSYSWIPHRVITASHYVKSMLVAKGMNTDFVDVGYPGVAIPQPLPVQKLRAELGLSQDDIVIGSIGALRKEKGFLDLVDAFYPLAYKKSNLKLVIIGDGDEFGSLLDRIKELGIQEQCFLLGQRNDVPELIGDFDIFALATYIEASGTAFSEAAAAKLPTVGYRTTGVPEMLIEGETGILVPLHDINALTNALSDLINNPEKRKKMGEQGHQFAIEENRFTLEALAASTTKSYKRWLEQLNKC